MSNFGSPSSQGLLLPTVVLVADHDVEYRRRLCAALGSAGYGVLEAVDGEEALRTLAESRVTAVFLDSSIATSCAELCRRIRANAALREVSLMVLATHDDAASVMQALDAGADDYSLKMTDIDVLLAKLRVQLRRRGIVHGPKSHPSGASPEPTSELDDAALTRLQESVDLHGVIDLIDALLDDVPERLATLFAALERRDAATIVVQAHRLKTSIATFGGMRISAECAAIEAMGREGRLSEIAAAAVPLRSHLERFSKELREARRLRTAQPERR